MLYPLFFKPISKQRLWGGRKLMDFLNKPFDGNEIGESWELSAISGDVSVVSDGPLKGKQINELIEIYKADLVGKSVYKRFGNDFPILIKYIDAQKTCQFSYTLMIIWQKSVITPLGKNEMWYIMDADPKAQLIMGFLKTLIKTNIKVILKMAILRTFSIMMALKEEILFLFEPELYMRLELDFTC